MGYSRSVLVWVVIVTLMMVSAASLVQSMWYDLTYFNVYATTASSDAIIGSFKIHVLENRSCSCCSFAHEDYEFAELDSAGEYLYIYLEDLNVRNVTAVWIGLVVENSGTGPTDLHDVVLDIYSPSESEVNISKYFYGPVVSVGRSGFWGHVNGCELPFDGAVTPPITMLPNEKVIVWIEVEIPKNTSVLDLTITVVSS